MPGSVYNCWMCVLQRASSRCLLVFMNAIPQLSKSRLTSTCLEKSIGSVLVAKTWPFLIFSRSWLNCLAACTGESTMMFKLKSANKRLFESIKLTISLILTKNQNRTKYWTLWNSEEMDCHPEKIFAKTTRCWRDESYDLNHSNICSCTPKDASSCTLY